MAPDTKHDMIGNALGALKESLADYVALGAGAAGVIVVSDLLMGRVLVSRGKPLVPAKLAPLGYAAVGVFGGEFVRRRFKGALADVGTGMIAGGVGMAVSAGIALLTSPVVAATTTTTTAAEEAGGGTQATAGFGFGRAFAPGLAGFGNLGRLRRTSVARQPMLFGVGTPDMSAANMFGGSTVQFEEKSRLGRATIEYSDASNPMSGIPN